MVFVAHTVTLEAVPRAWFTRLLAVVHDTASATRAEGPTVRFAGGEPVPDVLLTHGRHLRPGAQYGLTEDGATARLTVRQWDREGAVRLGYADGGGALGLDLELRSVAAPAEARLRIRARAGGVRITGDAVLDLTGWWKAAAGGDVARAPLRATVRHRFAVLIVRVVPQTTDSGAWELSCGITLRGRGPLRPLVSAALALARTRVAGAAATTAKRLAFRWNLVVPVAVAQDPKAVVERVIPAGHLGTG
ncbi:hypothetical protein [Streptomyces sp. NPDC050560]|uniref:hypothetical protein n=1 Tax=Streptomyces sp. NPDC050560 TaxID=3365630 RepID=UPI0037B4C04C